MVLTNSQYEQIMSKYYDRQLLSRHIAEERLREVTASIPELSSLNDKIREISLEHARRTLAGEQGTHNPAEQIEEITKRKEALLISHHYPADYLKPVYHCQECRDTGYVDGKRCRCLEKEIVDYLYSQSNLKDILENENFSHFHLDFYPDDYMEESTGQTPRDNMRIILESSRHFVDTFDSSGENLLLYGNTGVGKTFLTHCIAKELLDRSYTVVYLTSLKLFDILETYKFDRDLSQAEKTAGAAYIFDSDLLIIDDLGTELNNSFTSSQLYHCIDTRQNNRRSTIISTNLSFDDLRNRYSERIFSRITSSYSLWKLTGDDIRLKKALS